MNKKNTNNNDLFCPYYNQGMLIDAQTSGQSRVSMCCWQNRGLVDTSSFTHPYLESLRLQSQTKIPDPCSPFCAIPGHVANEREHSLHETWWDNSGKKIKKLHLKQGLICNLTCISCSSKLSSAWNKDYKHFEPDAPIVKLKKDTDASWENLDLRYLEQLHFDGGEPLLNTDNVNILAHLDKLGRLPHVTINYSTNGTIWPSDELIALWSKAKWVRLFFSLDGIESTFEYTRYPAKWDEVCNNIKKFQSLKGPCILIEANAIVGIHNIFNMADFYQWWKTNLQTGNQGDPSKVFVHAIADNSFGGRVLDLKYLPKELNLEAVNMLQSISDCPGALGLIPLLSKEDNSEWLDYFIKLDKIRGTNWKDSLPEQLLKNY